MTTTTIKSTFNPNHPEVVKYLNQVKSGWKVWFFLLYNLPSAIWWGFRVKTVTTEKGQVTIPYSWRTQNPFRSIYFAAQAGAAELSTAVLITMAKAGRGKISMLVADFRAEYSKKADTKITFTCEDGSKVIETIDRAIETGEGQKLTMVSTGRNISGEEVSKFYVTWTFKVKP